MTLRILFICIFSFILASCGSKKVVVKKRSRTVVVASKIKKFPSVNQEKHVRNLEKKSANLNKNVLQYILKYAPIAVHEMHASGIPASITLAQGILESGSGKSLLATKSNNHFGIKCHSKWQGARVYHDDDEKGECFRKYQFVETSYKDHSAFLSKRSRYAFLFDYNKKDYKKWAKGLRKAGYATDKKYPQKLIKLIKTYRLYEFDSFKKKQYKTKKSRLKEDEIVQSSPSKELKNTSYVVKKGDTLYAISRKFNVSVVALKKQNNLESNDLEIGKTLIIEY
jgi:flagellum-specific peptidoglycan hydrolase FlgJ|tara:strand:+ start:4296 stop:5141 length:846 start_codon:yes stop_codon:yes gene_type:complete